MSASTVVVGTVDLDENFNPMVKLAQECVKLGVSLPSELEEYFGDTIDFKCFPDNVSELSQHFSEVHLSEIDGAVEGYDVMADGVEIFLDKLPDDIKTIKVYLLA